MIHSFLILILQIGLLILTPEIVTLFIFDLLFILLGAVAFLIAIKIVRHYDANLTNETQYRLERESYLAATIMKYVFLIKLPLFLYFIFTLEKVALILPGAMCSAGVLNASDYGVYLMLLKILMLYLFAYWVFVNAKDMQNPNQPYVRWKFGLLIPLYGLLLLEILLEALLFFSIDTQKVVDCCGVVFSSSDGTYMAKLIAQPLWVHASWLYGVFVLMFFAFFYKNRVLFSLLNILFLGVALVTLIGSFGTYIYELPTHHCPFCLLSHDYNYVGYVLYILLFFGTFFGALLASTLLTNEQNRLFYISIFANTLYLSLVSFYVVLYLVRNSVLL